MKFRYHIPAIVFLVCVMLLFSAFMVEIASSETGPSPQDDALLTFFPLAGSEYLSGGFSRIAFDRYLDGSPITEDTILDGDEFSDAGINTCRSATRLLLC